MKTKLLTIEYKCTKCGIDGVKLWRQYNTFLDHLEVLCKDCAEKDQGKSIKEDSDRIGYLVPAIPTKEGDTFWGLGAVPTSLAIWWYRLPPEIPKKWTFPEMVSLNEDDINQDAVGKEYYTDNLIKWAREYAAVHKLGVSIDADGVAFRVEERNRKIMLEHATWGLQEAAVKLFYELEVIPEE